MMNRTTCFHLAKRLALGLAAVALAASPSFAADIDLCATTGSVKMPDGVVVPIWGFVEGTTCAGNATLPGPELRVPAGEPLNITLHNQLGAATSVFIPGQYKALAPVGGQGVGSRVSSFDAVVAPGGSATYTWQNPKAGTYLYHSGTDVRTQVPMGLYGALIVEPAPGCAYGDGITCDVAYDDDRVLVYSELDPHLNGDPANWGGARVSAWEPQYFLINGQAFNPSSPSSVPITVGDDVLLRLVSASLEAHVPSFGGGLYAEIVAEDGSLMPHRRSEYGIELHPGKTIDALVTAGSAASYALYDRMLHLTNAGLVGAGGGMLTYLQAATAAGAPIALADAYATDEDTPLSVTLPGVLGNDQNADGTPISATATAALASAASVGTVTLNADGSFDYTPGADFHGDAVFSYLASDAGVDSEAASVTITVNPVNDAPVAAADTYEVVEGTTLNVGAPGVLGNDGDVDGDSLSAALVGTAPAGLTLYGDGSFDYGPAGAANTSASFQYVANDGVLDSAPATVTILVIAAPANQPPTAVDDLFETSRNTDLAIFKTWIASNDTDADGTVVASSVTVTSPGGITQFGGTVVDLGSSLVYSPKPGFRGTDSFTYTIADDQGAVSAEGTVRINVVK